MSVLLGIQVISYKTYVTCIFPVCISLEETVCSMVVRHRAGNKSLLASKKRETSEERKKREDEEDDAMEKTCERWCGR